MLLWHLWIILAIILFILEIFTPGFLLGSLALGFLAISIADYLGVGFTGQVGVFSVSTIIVFFGIRPFFVRFVYRGAQERKTNVEALLGRVGRVIEEIDPTWSRGRVVVDGEEWRATSEGRERISAHRAVVVLGVEGAKLIVRASSDDREA